MGVKVALEGEDAQNWPSRQRLRVMRSLLVTFVDFLGLHGQRYQPRVCRSSFSSIAETARPFMEPVTCSAASARIFGSLKCVVAMTMALARDSASARSSGLLGWPRSSR